LLCLTKPSGAWFGLLIDVVILAGIATLPLIRSLTSHRSSTAESRR
jgi:hypothetical protein